ncbi:UBN2 domain-containing protein [Cephalotus follicularis]|uniref:UBN2 domain-containing protein n=1 Tax=Cephalotus follicularis TaxID=3775 RepID=A0A1Q3BI81_CEPFO|nr:UBN2 domain-containing protein [Cephalotus follicularis]
MTIFIQSLDYNLWDLIVNGPRLPTTTNESGETISKPRTSYNDEDRKRVQMNAKTKHVIMCAINSNDFNKVSSCISTKEMCDRLEVTNEITNQVEEAKVSMLVCEYEIFIMHENEDIKIMFTRFTNITNALHVTPVPTKTNATITWQVSFRKPPCDNFKTSLKISSNHRHIKSS